MRIKGVTVVNSKQGAVIMVTDRANQQPTLVEFDHDGDVEVRAGDNRLNFDPREVLALADVVQRRVAKRKAVGK